MSHQGNESCEDLHTALPRCLLFPLCPVALPPPHPPPPLHPCRLAQHEALQESLTDEMVGMAAALKASTLSVQDAVRCLPGLGGGAGWRLLIPLSVGSWILRVCFGSMVKE